MTQLEFARLNSNLYKNLNDYCRLMACVKCPFYVTKDKCMFEQCRETLQPLVFDKVKNSTLPAKTSDRLDDLENRVGRVEELIAEIQQKIS